MSIKEALTSATPVVNALNNIGKYISKCNDIDDLNKLRLKTKQDLETLKNISDGIDKNSSSVRLQAFCYKLNIFISTKYSYKNSKKLYNIFEQMNEICKSLIESCEKAKWTDLIGGPKIKNATTKFQSNINKFKGQIEEYIKNFLKQKISEFTNKLNESNFFDNVENAETLEKSYEFIKQCAQKMSEVFNNNKEALEKANIETIFPGLYVWYNTINGALDSISSKPENFNEFKIHVIVLVNLSKKILDIGDCANKFQDSYNKALNKVNQLKEIQEKIEEELKKLYVVDKRAFMFNQRKNQESKQKQQVPQQDNLKKLILKTDTAYNVAINGVKSSTYNKNNNAYIIIDEQGNIMHEKFYPNQNSNNWKCINKTRNNYDKAIGEVKDYLNNVLKYANFDSNNWQKN